MQPIKRMYLHIRIVMPVCTLGRRLLNQHARLNITNIMNILICDERYDLYSRFWQMGNKWRPACLISKTPVTIKQDFIRKQLTMLTQIHVVYQQHYQPNIC